ncbi:MAG: DUF3995 domain-containing protein [Caldilineaceae bacterium]
MIHYAAHQSRLSSPQLHSPRPRALVWSGYAVFIWSIGYMLPHLYWALGGTAGQALLRPSILELPQWELINWAASVFLTGAGLIGLAFVYIRRRGFVSWLLLAIALAGCSVAASHGIYGIVDRILQIAGVATVESAPFDLSEHAYVVWDLVLYEPWFLIEGILFGLVGWYYLEQPRQRYIWLTLCVLGVVVGLVTGLLGVRFA